MEREALKLALEALQEARTNDDSCEKWDRNKEAITAIKAALAQPAQEPEIEALKLAVDGLQEIALAGMAPSPEMSENGIHAWHARQAWNFIGIAARQLAAIKAVEQTHCQCKACINGNIHDSDCSVHNGDALPEGPCDCRLAALAQPAQEPVARVSGTYGGRFVYEPVNRAAILPIGMALYSSPQGNT